MFLQAKSGVIVCWCLCVLGLVFLPAENMRICISMLRICIYIKYIIIHEHAQHRLELLAMASSWPFYAQSFFEQNICKSKWAGSNDIWIPHLSDIIVTSAKTAQFERKRIIRRNHDFEKIVGIVSKQYHP